MFLRAFLLLSCALVLRVHAAEPEPPLPAFDFEHYLIAPLRVHFLGSEKEPALCTSLTDADLERIIGKVNHVWRQAGIALVVESIMREKLEPDEAPDAILPGGEDWLPKHVRAANYGPDQFHVYYLKQFRVNGIYYPKALFVKDTASLRPVAGGIDEPIPRVTSHEFGHALGLAHRQDTFNLMASGTTGTSLNASEVEAARWRASAFPRFKTGPEWLVKAAALRAEKKEVDAVALEKKLAALPMDSSKLDELRARHHVTPPPIWVSPVLPPKPRPPITVRDP
jgi:hypothetical protein